MENITITVVVPIYNSEMYLRKCLDSVVMQTLENIEIILINDCSSDGSKNIIEEYSRADNRIISVEQKENLGVSAARNAGIERANGKYIIFLDADDYWLEKTMLETLLDIADSNRADIVTFGLRIIDPQGKQLGLSVEEDRVVDLKRSNDWHFNYSPFKNLLSRELIEKYNIRFDPVLVMGEDALFNITIFCYASTQAVIKNIFYHYQISVNSANTSTWSKHKLSCTALWFERAIPVIRNSPVFDRYPGLLQELINERLGMLTRKLIAMALVMFDKNEFDQYISIWARCFAHLDYAFFESHIYPAGWPALQRDTADIIINKTPDELRVLYSK